jgi:hypothetical protein
MRRATSVRSISYRLCSTLRASSTGRARFHSWQRLSNGCENYSNTISDSAFAIERALAIAVEVEETELEDMVGDLLKALQEHDEYERCQRLLVHDLGELSYMIEQHCQDAALLQRCDELVNHHAETLRNKAGRQA